MARFRFFKSVKRDLATTFTQWLALVGGGSTASGAEVTSETALKFTGVLSAVSLRADLIAASPKDIMVIKADWRSPDYNDPLYNLLAYTPNPHMNAYTFWELMSSHLDLWGNAYAAITRKKGQVVALSPIYPGYIIPEVVDGKLIYKIDGDPRFKAEIKPSDILHFKDISDDGIKGKSRIILAKEAIGLGLAAEKFGAEFFGNGSQARGILEHPAQMGDKAFDRFKESWNKKENMSTPILEEGMKYNQITIPPEAAQFIASREFQLQDIARVYRVPPHLMADLSRATFSNIEQSDIQFVKYTLRPLTKRFEQELEIKLLGDQVGKKNIRFNLDGILRGDTAARTAYYAAMKQNKIMTTNEIRAKEGLPPIDGGDILENPATSSGKDKKDGE